jgi:hypothetical protein
MLKSTVLALALVAFGAGLGDRAQAQGTAPLGLHEVAALAPQADLRDRELVRVIQRSLRSHGLYGGAIDGIAGPRTLRGLRLAQDLVAPWIVPVLRQDFRTLPHVVIHGARPVYVTGQVAVTPAPIYAPVAPWHVMRFEETRRQ